MTWDNGYPIPRDITHMTEALGISDLPFSSVDIVPTLHILRRDLQSR